MCYTKTRRETVTFKGDDKSSSVYGKEKSIDTVKHHHVKQQALEGELYKALNRKAAHFWLIAEICSTTSVLQQSWLYLAT